MLLELPYHQISKWFWIDVYIVPQIVEQAFAWLIIRFVPIFCYTDKLVAVFETIYRINWLENWISYQDWLVSFVIFAPKIKTVLQIFHHHSSFQGSAQSARITYPIWLEINSQIESCRWLWFLINCKMCPTYPNDTQVFAIHRISGWRWNDLFSLRKRYDS